MRIVIVSRYPLADVPAWKRQVAGRLLETGHELGVLYSRAPVADHLQAAIGWIGIDAVRRALTRDPSAAAARSGGRRRSLASWARARGVPVLLHKRLDDPECSAALRALCPDLMLLAGADIVPASLLAIPAAGAINPHYGLLPSHRGMNVTEWSIYEDHPVGVTVHYVSPGIDTGDILLSERVAVEPGDTLSTLRRKHQDAAARLLPEAVERVRSGTAQRRPQAEAEGKQYYRMHPLLAERVERKLAAGGYRWMGEGAG